MKCGAPFESTKKRTDSLLHHSGSKGLVSSKLNEKVTGP